MYERIPDYLQILSNPKQYLSIEPKLERYEYDSALQREYPVGRVDDVELHFNHYFTFDEAINKWNSRVAKVNWNNLFVMMYTDDYEEANRFIDLPYVKKYVSFHLKRLNRPYCQFHIAGKKRYAMCHFGLS